MILSWKLKQQRVHLSIGAYVLWSYDVTIEDFEAGGWSSSVLRDADGVFLAGYASNVRPELWYKEMWPEMSISFDDTVVCRDAERPKALVLRVNLEASDGSCAVDGRNARCCNLAGREYEVACLDAWRSASGVFEEYADLFVARRELIGPAP